MDATRHALACIARAQGAAWNYDPRALGEAAAEARTALVSAMGELDLEGSVSARHVFELYATCVHLLAEARREPEGAALDQSAGLLRAVAALDGQDEHEHEIEDETELRAAA